MISVVVLFIAFVKLDLCSECCLGYQCGDFKTSSTCNSNEDYSDNPCFWDGSACRIGTCSDLTSYGQTACESYVGPACKWNSDSCVEVSSCSAWNGNPDCSSKRYNQAPCVTDGSNCRAGTCADLGGGYYYDCENEGLSCVYNSTTKNCAPATACSAWNDASDISRCNNRKIGDGSCTNVNGECKIEICSSYAVNQGYCESKGCKWSSGSCTEVNSCSGWTGTTQTLCENGYQNTGNGWTGCVWESNACRAYSCSDFNSSQTTCESTNKVGWCKWDNNNCIYVENYCRPINTQSACNSQPHCTYLEGSCPSPPSDAAFAVFIPSAVMVMLLSLIFW